MFGRQIPSPSREGCTLAWYKVNFDELDELNEVRADLFRTKSHRNCKRCLGKGFERRKVKESGRWWPQVIACQCIEKHADSEQVKVADVELCTTYLRRWAVWKKGTSIVVGDDPMPGESAPAIEAEKP